MAQAPSSTNIIIGGDIPGNIDSFTRHIRAENLSPATLDAYVGATQQFYRYLVDKGMPLDVVRRRFNLSESELRDFCSDIMDDGADDSDRSSASGY